MRIGPVCGNSLNKHHLWRNYTWKTNFKKMRVFLKSSMLACIKFQADWTKADWLPHCFLAPTSCSQRLAWKTKNPVCPHKHCCTAQTCSQRSRFSCDCSHKYLLRACQLTRMYLFFFYIFFELYERWSTCVFGASKRMKFWRSYDVKQMKFLDYRRFMVCTYSLENSHLRRIKYAK